MIFLVQVLTGFVGEIWMKMYVNILTVSVCQYRLKLRNISLKSGKNLFHSPDEIQERLSVLCGYWCLYYLIERQNGRETFEVLHNTEFSPNNQMVNYNFLKRYFNTK